MSFLQYRMFRYVTVFSFFILFTFGFKSVYAADNIISPTISHVSWDSAIYTVQGYDFRIQEDDNAGGVAYRYQFDSGFLAGVDAYYINAFEFSAVDSSFGGHGNSTHVIASGGYTFNHTGQVQFFVEAGLGYGSISLHSGGGPNAKLNGLDQQYTLGMNYFFNHRLGLRTAIKRIDFDLDDDAGAKMDGELDLYSLSLNIRF